MNESGSRGEAGAAAVRSRRRTRPPPPTACSEPPADVARLQTRSPRALCAALCAPPEEGRQHPPCTAAPCEPYGGGGRSCQPLLGGKQAVGSGQVTPGAG